MRNFVLILVIMVTVLGVGMGACTATTMGKMMLLVEENQAHHIHHEPSNRNSQQTICGYLLRIKNPLKGLENDQCPNKNQQNSIHIA